METIPENAIVNYSSSQSTNKNKNKYYYQNDFEIKMFKKIYSK